MNRSLFRLGLCAVLALLVSASGSLVYAQGGSTSTISGTVSDPSGAVLPGATITAKHLTSGVVTTSVSNNEGAFTMASLPTGTYEVTVSLEGFKTFVAKDVVLTAVQGAGVNAKLEVGGITEMVTVASTSEIIQTQSSTVSATINTNQITKLPLVSRSAMDFVNGLPGVSTPAGSRQATINGLPQAVINITLDGINIQDNTNRTGDGFFAIVSPRLDAIEEVSVTTAGQGADAGQGAVQIKFVTRSGGNSFSGSGYHYYRSDRLNANTWFNNRAGTAKAALLQNQFGARAGGPLLIPGLVSRGKAFFFGNYEELRQPGDVTRNRNLLNPSAMAGNYTYTAAGVTRTINVLQVGASVTPGTSTVDPTIAQLLTDIRGAAAGGALETVDDNLDRLRFNVATTSKRIFPTGRIDYNITDAHRFTSAVNYNWYADAPDTLNNMEPTFPGFAAAAGQASTRIGWSNTLRSSLGRNFVNEVRVGYSGAPVKFFEELNPEMYANTKGFQLGVTGGTSNNLISVGENITGASRIPIPQSRNATDLTIEDNVTWLKGSHSLTAGGSWANFNVWLENSSLVPRIQFGMLTADPAQAAFVNANFPGASPTQLTAARNLYSLLTGRVTTLDADAVLNEGTGEYEYVGAGLQRSNMQEYDFFVQDSWRWRPNLTINAGVRYALQRPFTASNNSYTSPTLEDVCGKSGIDPNTGYCNLFQPGVMPGKPNPQFFQLEKGKDAYNTDWDNYAPNIGFAWTPAPRGGLLGTLMSDEFVVRGGWARAFSRNGMGDFTGTYNSNPGVVIQTPDRSEGLGNIVPAGGTAPVLFRNDADLLPAAFPRTPVYPMTDVVTQDINMFDPNIEIPSADSWSFGIQRKVSTNMALEVRYVGTNSSNAWTTRNFNELNIHENGFLDEFRNAQHNLRANVAAGRGATFAHVSGSNTVPLPLLVAFLNGTATAPYSGALWTNAGFVTRLATLNPSPFGLAGDFRDTASIRNNATAAGIPANFLLANPDLLGGANIVLNSHKTRYSSLQVELRRRLSQGLQFQSSYVFGNADQTAFVSHRRALYWQRDTGTPGDLTHQFKFGMVYDLPFGQGQRFAGGAGPVMDRIVGGWQIGLTTRMQSGLLVDIGNVRLVGWSRDDVQNAFKMRFDDAAKKIYMWPQEVIDNTILAFSVSGATVSGYSGVAPTGRHFAPANGPDCIEVGRGECPNTTDSLVVTGPTFYQSDLRIAKRTTIKGSLNIEFAAEALNVFNRANFVPLSGIGSVLTNYEVTAVTGSGSRIVQLVSRINW